MKWVDLISNEQVRHPCRIPQLGVRIHQRRLQLFGHVLRKPDDELVKEILNPTSCSGWKYRHGGQLKTWLTTVKSDVEQQGLQSVYSIRHWKQNWVAICADLSANRRAWAAVIRNIHEAESSFQRSYLQ